LLVEGVRRKGEVGGVRGREWGSRRRHIAEGSVTADKVMSPDEAPRGIGMGPVAGERDTVGVSGCHPSRSGERRWPPSS